MTVEMTTASPYAQTPSPPQANAEQLARAARRRRFNLLYVYLPLGLVALLWLGLILGMLWLAVVGRWFAMDTNPEYYRSLISGVADAFAILMITPLLVLCALPMVLTLGLVIYRRRSDRNKPPQPQSLPIMWRIENFVTTVQGAVESAMDSLAHPLISAHAIAAFIRTFLVDLRQIISQEFTRYDNDR